MAPHVLIKMLANEQRFFASLTFLIEESGIHKQTAIRILLYIKFVNVFKLIFFLFGLVDNIFVWYAVIQDGFFGCLKFSLN